MPKELPLLRLQCTGPALAAARPESDELEGLPSIVSVAHFTNFFMVTSSAGYSLLSPKTLMDFTVTTAFIAEVIFH